jgi:hypothetical protein
MKYRNKCILQTPQSLTGLTRSCKLKKASCFSNSGRSESPRKDGAMSATGNFLADLCYLCGKWPLPEGGLAGVRQETVRSGKIPDVLVGVIDRIERRFEGSGPTFEFQRDLLQPFTDWMGASPEEWAGIEGYPFHKRGLLWYGTGLLVNGKPVGPIIFLRDGWAVVPDKERGSFQVGGWDDWINHRWIEDSLVFTADDSEAQERAEREEKARAELIGQMAGARMEMVSVKQIRWFEQIPWSQPLRISAADGDAWGQRSLRVAYHVLRRMESEVRRSRKNVMSMTSDHIHVMATKRDLTGWLPDPVSPKAMDARVLQVLDSTKGLVLEGQTLTYSVDASRKIALVSYRLPDGQQWVVQVSGQPHTVGSASFFTIVSDVTKAPTPQEAGKALRAVGLRMFGGLCLDGDGLVFKADLPLAIDGAAFMVAVFACADVAYRAKKALNS